MVGDNFRLFHDLELYIRRAWGLSIYKKANYLHKGGSLSFSYFRAFIYDQARLNIIIYVYINILNQNE